MNIAIIDADLIGRSKHRFPNLACMKLSGYYKEQGNNVKLKTDYENLSEYDIVYISKVFTDTPIDNSILELPNVKYGGTGFYYDKAQPLPYEVEHHMPDYHLYDDWVNENLYDGIDKDDYEDEEIEAIIKKRRKDFEYYLDYSIGFMTRGCFRQCQFCVNKNYTKVELHSSLSEFYDKDRKYICLLDDNVLGCKEWKSIFNELIATNKPFQFKQGMDERILTDEKCEMLAKCKYNGDYIFAFDNIQDKDIIEKKLKLLRKYIPTKNIKFYVFCGYDRNDKWDNDFWKQDIADTFERVKILMKYHCLPYIMRYNRYVESPYKTTYISLASWCNQPSIFKKKSYREFCKYFQRFIKSDKICSYVRELHKVEQEIPNVAQTYFDIKYSDFTNE